MFRSQYQQFTYWFIQLMFYSTSTFTKAGMSNPDVATCGVGTVSVVMVAVSVSCLYIWLCFLSKCSESLALTFAILYFHKVFLMDRVGRRSLMLIGLAGMFVFYGIITISYALQVISIELFVCSEECKISVSDFLYDSFRISMKTLSIWPLHVHSSQWLSFRLDQVN